MQIFSNIKALLQKTALWILLAPIAITFVGVASNQAVLIANHDKFPVMVNYTKLQEYIKAYKISRKETEFEEERPLIRTLTRREHSLPLTWQSTAPDDMIDDVHCVMTPDTHLNALADIFDFHSAIYSVGDGLLILGEWLQSFMPFVWMFAVVDKLRKQAQ